MGKIRICKDCRYFKSKGKRKCTHRTYFGPKVTETTLACKKLKPLINQ